MKQFNQILCESSDKISRDFEVGLNVFSKQTKAWLKALDSEAERIGVSYNDCRLAARKFKQGDFEGALRTIWGKDLEVDTEKSENGMVIVTTYIVSDYAVFTEKIIYKNNTFSHSITGNYTGIDSPGYSLGTVINVYGKSDQADIELFDDKKTREAMAARNTANIYNILFVGCDIHSKFISKPMLKLKKPL
jgi:hypothetical protein